MSLLLRLWLSLALSFTLLTAILGWSEYKTLERASIGEVDRNLENRAQYLAQELRLGHHPQGLMSPDLEPFEELGKVFVEIRDAQGQLLAASSNMGSLHMPTGLLGGDGATQFLTPLGHPMRMVQLTVPNSNSVIRVCQSLELTERTLHDSIRKLIGLWLLSSLLAAASSRWVLRRAFGPLQEVSEVAQHIAKTGDVTARVTTASDVPQVQQVAVTLNGLLERVEKLLAAQKRLLSDTSHELRNPLTVLQMDLEMLAGNQLDEATRQEVSEEAQGELQRLIRLVEDLLLMSWAESGPVMQLETVRLDQILDPLVARYANRCGNRKIRWLGQPVEVRCDPLRVEQILRNLVDNALRYTKDTGRITLWIAGGDSYQQIGLPAEQLQLASDKVMLVIQDDGVGIAPEHWSSLFERFWRLEPDRNRIQGGSGLGLPLARALARAMGGDLTVYSQKDAGSSFMLTLQRAQ